jgi:hypothetical protein
MVDFAPPPFPSLANVISAVTPVSVYTNKHTNKQRLYADLYGIRTSCVKKTVLISYQVLTSFIQRFIEFNGFGLGFKPKVTGSHTVPDAAATIKNQ